MDPWNNKSVKDDSARDQSFPDFSDESGAGGAPKPHEKPLVYEETPVIEPVTDEIASQLVVPDPVPEVLKTPELPAPHVASVVQPSPGRKVSFVGTFFMILVFAALFGVGVFASMALREVFPDGIALPFAAQQEEDPELSPAVADAPPSDAEPTPRRQEVPENLEVSDSGSSGDADHVVMTAGMKTAVSGVSFRIPQSVQAPICDGNNCASQGTNLPGGSRFTVAARGKGQGLPLTKGAKLVDGSGRDFVLTDVTVAGFSGRQFIGNFSGRTLNGFSFSKIQGLILEVAPGLEIEMSVFAPSGQDVEWENDVALFEQIAKTLRFDGATPAVASPTPTTTAQSGATGSSLLDDVVQTGP